MDIGARIEVWLDGIFEARAQPFGVFDALGQRGLCRCKLRNLRGGRGGFRRS